MVVSKLPNMDWQQNLDQTGLNQSLLTPPTQVKGGGGGAPNPVLSSILK